MLREEAPGCDTGACLRPAGVEPSRAGASYANDPRVADRAADGECTASCEADADCERFRASAAGCPGPYVCARPLGAGAAACRRLCVCSARLGRVVAESPATFPRPACAAPSGLVAALPGGALLAPTGDGCAPVSTTIEIRNEGAQATGALEVALDEAAGAAGPFRVGEPACAGALAPGAGCAVTITYDPRAAGPGATRLVVRAAPGGTLVVPLAGAPGACGGAAAGGTGDYRAAGPAAPGR